MGMVVFRNCFCGMDREYPCAGGNDNCSMKKAKWSSKPYEKERQEFYEKQKGCCAICDKPQSAFKHRLSLDHNHKTGQLRGLLCFRCNKFIVGRHTLETAARLFAYLQIERKGNK